MTSDILQREVLQWFRIFIGDLDERMESALSNSVDKLPPGKTTTHWAVLAKSWSAGAGKWIFLSLPPSETTLGALSAV